MWHGFVERDVLWLAAYKLVRLRTNTEDITTSKARKDNVEYGSTLVLEQASIIGRNLASPRQQYLFD